MVGDEYAGRRKLALPCFSQSLILILTNYFYRQMLLNRQCRCLKTPQRVQVSLWCILIGYFGVLSIYHNTWTLWAQGFRLSACYDSGALRDTSGQGAPLKPPKTGFLVRNSR